MKRLAIAAVVIGLMAGGAYAQHEGRDQGKHMGDMKGGHGAMKGHEEGAGLGKQVFKGEKKGVKVKAWLNDMESAMKAMEKDSGMKMDMSKMDPDITHHIAITITGDESTGAIKGAALKVSLKNASKQYPLMSMHGHYGSDISLKDKGAYKAELTVETEKAGKQNFSFTIKN